MAPSQQTPLHGTFKVFFLIFPYLQGKGNDISLPGTLSALGTWPQVQVPKQGVLMGAGVSFSVRG